MKLIELFEYKDDNIRWAVGSKHTTHATRPHQNRMKYGGYDDMTLVWVKIKDVFDNVHGNFTLDVNDPMGGKNYIGDRVPRASQHWESGGWMDPAIIGWSEYDNAIMFSDGRHRLVAAYQKGYTWAPVLVPTDEISIIRNVVPLLKRRPSKITETAGAFNMDGYGSWLNTNTGEIISVSDVDSKSGHVAMVLSNPGHFGLEQSLLKHKVDDDYWYDVLAPIVYQNGWVRIEHKEEAFSIGVQGIKDNLKKAWSFIKRNLQRTEEVYVDVIGPDGEHIEDITFEVNANEFIDKITAGKNKRAMKQWFTT